MSALPAGALAASTHEDELEAEQAKDIWAMSVFGHRGRLDFTAISQPWLREGTKRPVEAGHQRHVLGAAKSRCPTAPAANPRTSKLGVAPAHSGSAASAATTSTPIPPICPS